MIRPLLGSLLVLTAGCSSADEIISVTLPAGVGSVEASPGTEPPASTSIPLVAETNPVVDSIDATTDVSGVQPEGFTTATVQITKPDGTVCEVCMWLADDATERGRGLMGVTDLGDAEGMAFVFDRPTTGNFFMFQTVTPLSIAWFAPGTTSTAGAVVSTADMDPCPFDNSSSCERFPAGGEFDLAIEVFQGDLSAVGIEAGSTARVLLDTEAVSCPVTP